MHKISDEELSVKLACDTIGIQYCNSDRFIACAIEWLGQSSQQIRISKIDDGWCISCYDGDFLTISSVDDNLLWAVAGAVHCMERFLKRTNEIKVENDNKTTISSKSNLMFGTCSWAGIYQGLPAIVLGYYGGAQLWVLSNEKWTSIAKGPSEHSVTPRKCDNCGSQLPIIDEKD